MPRALLLGEQARKESRQMTQSTKGYIRAFVGMTLALATIMVGDFHPIHSMLGPNLSFAPQHLALWACALWLMISGLLRLLATQPVITDNKRGAESVLEGLVPKTSCDSDCIPML